VCSGRTRRWRRPWLDSEDKPLVEFEIVVPAVPRHLDQLHEALARLWGEVDRLWSRRPDPVWRAEFATGVGEIADNIVQHAYSTSPPGMLTCRLRVFDHAVEACFTDTGTAYVPSSTTARDEPDDPMSLLESGRGLALAEATVDELTYTRAPGGLNQWCLRKRSLSVDSRSAE